MLCRPHSAFQAHAAGQSYRAPKVYWTSAEVEALLQHFAEAYNVADGQAISALVKGELQDFLPVVADPSMWQSLEVGYLLSHASQSWHLESADPVGKFLQQLPESQASGLTTAYTDFGL